MQDHVTVVDWLAAGHERIAIKAPDHLAHLEALISALGPNARVIELLRDFDTCMRSYSRLVVAARSGFSDSVDGGSILREVRETWSGAVGRFQQTVSSAEWNTPTLQIPFQELTGHPLKTLATIYQFMGWGTPSQDEQSVVQASC
jgi:hypothetical protein